MYISSFLFDLDLSLILPMWRFCFVGYLTLSYKVTPFVTLLRSNKSHTAFLLTKTTFQLSHVLRKYFPFKLRQMFLNIRTPEHSNGLKADRAGVSLSFPFSKSIAEASGGQCACLGIERRKDVKDLAKLQKSYLYRMTEKRPTPDV